MSVQPERGLAPAEVLLGWVWRWRLALVAGVAALHAACFTGRWLPGEDSAAFLSLARQIGRTGGTTTPVALEHGVMTGYAWWLAGVWQLLGGVGEASDAGRGVVLAALVVNVLAVVLLMAAVMRLFALRGERALGVWLAVLCGVCVTLAERVVDVLPDTLFAAGTAVWLLGVESLRQARQVGSAPRRTAAGAWVLIGVGAAMMLSLRTPALVMLGAWGVAVVLTALLRGRWKPALAVAGAVAAVSLLAWALVPAVADDVATVFRVLREDGPRRLLLNARHLFGEHLGEAVFGVDPGAAGWAASAVILLGVARLYRERLLYGVLVTVLIAQWLVFLPLPRYVLPVQPLLLLGLWRLAAGASARLHRRFGDHGHWPVIAFTVLVVGGNVTMVVNLTLEQWARRGAEAGAIERDFIAAHRVAAQIRSQQVPPGSVLLNKQPHPSATMWWADIWSVPWLPYREGGVRLERADVDGEVVAR